MDVEQKAAAIAGLQKALDVLSETDYGPVLAEWQEHLDSIAAALAQQQAVPAERSVWVEVRCSVTVV